MNVLFRTNARRGAFAAVAVLVAWAAPAFADEPKGTVTGLPLPRYASLKTDRVNLREGPSKDHATKWVFQRAGLPVEITAEFSIWRKVRDSEGAEGWVLHTLLSGRRTAIVGAGKKDQTFDVEAQPSVKSDVSAKLQAGVIVNIRKCDGAWCRVFGQGFDGYVHQVDLWGVYPDEKVE
jgi:SH3-like domain-containing protein